MSGYPAVVVTGCGLVHPLGDAHSLTARSLPAHWSTSQASAEALHAAVSGLSDLFPRQSLRRLPVYVRLALLAAARALQDGGLWPCPTDLPLVIGSASVCQKTSFDFMDSILAFGPGLASPLAFSHAVNNMAAGLLSLMLHTTGACTTITNSLLSFAGALETATVLLTAHRAPAVLVGAVDEWDARFAGIFPGRELVPAAAFFCLRLADDQSTPCTRPDTDKAETQPDAGAGAEHTLKAGSHELYSLELAWEDSQREEAVCLADGAPLAICTAGPLDSLFQPLACAACCAEDVHEAHIRQSAPEYGMAATIRLHRRPDREYPC